MPSHTSVSPERIRARATAGRIVEASVANAEALWWAFAVARGHRVVDDPAWLVVDAGNDVGGTRVILRTPVDGELELASLYRLIEGASRPVTVEDPFASVDLHAQGLVPRSLSVMGAGPLTPDVIPNQDRTNIIVCRAANEEHLLDADRIVVAGFPRPTTYQPYRPGRMLPAGLLKVPDVSVFVADFLGAPCGACMTVKDTHGVGGVYWVAVLAEHRRAGIGRALMLAAMRELAGMPIVLSATQQGAPLYQKLGFETAIQSTWWASSNPT